MPTDFMTCLRARNLALNSNIFRRLSSGCGTRILIGQDKEAKFSGCNDDLLRSRLSENVKTKAGAEDHVSGSSGSLMNDDVNS